MFHPRFRLIRLINTSTNPLRNNFYYTKKINKLLLLKDSKIKIIKFNSETINKIKDKIFSETTKKINAIKKLKSFDQNQIIRKASYIEKKLKYLISRVSGDDKDMEYKAKLRVGERLAYKLWNEGKSRYEILQIIYGIILDESFKKATFFDEAMEVSKWPMNYLTWLTQKYKGVRVKPDPSLKEKMIGQFKNLSNKLEEKTKKEIENLKPELENIIKTKNELIEVKSELEKKSNMIDTMLKVLWSKQKNLRKLVDDLDHIYDHISSLYKTYGEIHEDKKLREDRPNVENAFEDMREDDFQYYE